MFTPPASSPKNNDFGFKFIPDGKSIVALVFPVIWLAWYRLWFWLTLYLVIVLAFGMLAEWSGNPVFGLVSVLPGLYFFLEGNALRSRALEQKGWQLDGVVFADNEEEAELRYLFRGRKEVTPPHHQSESKSVTHTGLKSVTPTGIFPE